MSKRLLIRDQEGERERLLVGTMTVGRDTRCDISDADPLLSRRHAEFVCRPDSLLVRDLNSRNGIAVNGAKVKEAVLRPGDVVKIARLVMTYLGDLDSILPSSPLSRTIDLPLQPTPPPPATVPPLSYQAPASADGRAAEADKARLRTPTTEKMSRPARGASNLDDGSPEDDRTKVVPRRSGQGTATPSQLAVARMTPPAQSLPQPPSTVGGSAPEDPERTRPIIRQADVKTDTPVLPLSALRLATPAPVEPVPALSPPPIAERPVPPRPVAPPPILATPQPAASLDDWSLEFRARPVEAPPLAPTAPRPRSGRILFATVGLATLVFTLTAVPMTVWVAYRPDVPAVLWNFVVVLGPALLCSIAAGVGVAWWLRRTTTGG
jgi:hypothetical protein